MIAVYARVSTEEQAKHGYSLKEQVRQCREKANGVDDIIEYVDEGASGEFLDRPALMKLRKDIKEGIINKVICYDPDRLSRKLQNALIVTEEIERRAELIFVNGEYAKTPEGMFFYQLRGAVAEFEKSKITERMSSGRRQKARQGKVVKDYHVYGYDYDNEKSQLVINEAEGKIVRFIFEAFTNDDNRFKGINGIAKFLTEQGIPTKKNASQWHRQVVRQIIMNSVYMGTFYQNKWNTEGMLGNKHREEDDKVKMTQRSKDDWIEVPCPAIIEPEMFELAKRKLETSRRRWQGNSKNTYMLSGLIRCGNCGNTMTGRKSRNWGKDVLEYSDVKNTAGAKHKGCGHRWKCEDLDQVVWEGFIETLKQRKESFLNDETEEVKKQLFEEIELERVEAEMERIKKSKKNLIKFIAQMDDLDAEDVRTELKELQEEERSLLAKKEDLTETLEVQDETDNEASNSILDEVTELLEQEDAFTTEQKKEILRRCVREIRIYKEEESPIEVYTI
jgi:site-specific DNA recombinase